MTQQTTRTINTLAYDAQTHAMRHIIDIETMPLAVVETLYKRADFFMNGGRSDAEIQALAQQSVVAQLFFEHSTRTRCSFEIAAKKLTLPVVHFNPDTSSLHKDESWLDTVYNLHAMGCNICVVRHSSAGMAAHLAHTMAHQISVINAGDGMHSHPTQALLDVHSLSRMRPAFPDVKLAIIGDVHHSRIARSLMQLLHLYKVKDVRVFAPGALLPDATHIPQQVCVCDCIEDALDGVDAVCALRLQQERMDSAYIANRASYFHDFGITTSRLQLCHPDAVILHPGPVNWNVEVADDIAHRVIALQQVTHGVAIRMAIFEHLLHQQKNSGTLAC